MMVKQAQKVVARELTPSEKAQEIYWGDHRAAQARQILAAKAVQSTNAYHLMHEIERDPEVAEANRIIKNQMAFAFRQNRSQKGEDLSSGEKADMMLRDLARREGYLVTYETNER